jgi:inorganic pyrophosphatase
MMKSIVIPISMLLFVASCDIVTPSLDSVEEQVVAEVINYAKLPTFLEDGSVQAVVEIPAGTTAKREYNYENNNFPIDIKNGKSRYVNFLGYPGNYGFIPSTMMDKERGGDGDALDILILSQPATFGQAISITPIAIIQLIDNGEIDDKLIAIPTTDSLKTIKANTLAELELKYPAVKTIIETWFTNYKGVGQIQVIGWQDEKAALAAVKKWQVN